MQPDLTLPKFDPQNFCFQQAPNKQEMTGGSFVLAIPHADRVDACRQALRKLHISMSTAITALSVKTMAVLIEQQQGDANPDAKPLMAKTLMDLRPMGKWGDDTHPGDNDSTLVCHQSILNSVSAESATTESGHAETLRAKMLIRLIVSSQQKNAARETPNFTAAKRWSDSRAAILLST